MAFRTNKVPAIEERSVSGSSVSFNSAFALPLKACKVSFSATQAGSGDPSPSNPYTISGVSGLNLSANSVPVSVNFGDTYYGGEIDLLTGILTVTHEKVTYNGTERWTYREQSDSVYHIQPDINKAYNLQNGNCNIFPIVDNLTTFGCLLGANNSAIYVNKVADLGLTNADEFKTWLTTHNMTVVYPLAEPTIIQLSANELSSIIGNNTFSTDTGTLEITFADLQEKSASGAVASFNTALAMPLASCNIGVDAWQEGSGDPSPSNVRAIHGFSEVNATRAGKNLFDAYKLQITGTPSITVNSSDSVTVGVYGYQDNYNKYDLTDLYGKNFTLSLHYKTEVISNPSARFGVNFFDADNVRVAQLSIPLNSLDYENDLSINIPVNAVRFSFGSWGYSGRALITKMQIEAGSTATVYEPYVTPTIYTIQLGQEVYGGVLDVDNGVATVTDRISIFNGLETGWATGVQQGFIFSNSTYGVKRGINQDGMCNKFKVGVSWSTTGIRIGQDNYSIYFLHITDTMPEITSLEDWRAWLQNNPVTILYPLETPFDIQLTPTQIETLIGNNTIFADTGDVELTYKDLDIAKRGSFREVFRLPS